MSIWEELSLSEIWKLLNSALWMNYFVFLPEVNWPHKRINSWDEFGWCQDRGIQGCPFRLVKIIETNQVLKTIIVWLGVLTGFKIIVKREAMMVRWSTVLDWYSYSKIVTAVLNVSLHSWFHAVFPRVRIWTDHCLDIRCKTQITQASVSKSLPQRVTTQHKLEDIMIFYN